MKFFSVLLPGLLFFTTAFSQSQRVISDCTVQYDLVLADKSDAELVKSMQGATKTIYIKGPHSRTDLVSPAYTQTVINDSRSDTSVILTDRGNTKILSYITAEKRKAYYKRFEGITFAPTGETKTILGYDCIKAEGKMKDGSVMNVFYAPSIIPSSRQTEYQFNIIPGFVLEYETQSENINSKIKYTATKITISPVPASKFEIPKSGYRIL